MTTFGKRLEGKIALITGGNSGIGLATAKLFREHGAQVIITARSVETAAKAKRDLGDLFDVVQTDVGKLEEIDRLYKYIATKYKYLDVVFANAGVAQLASSADTTPEVYDQIMNVNTRGAYFTVTKALPLLRDGSSVLVNGSIAAVKGVQGSSVYSATKAAVRSFVRTWTAEIPPSKTRFNVVAPGPVTTPIHGKMELTDEQLKFFAQGTPAKRFGTPEEIANVALFLASSESSFISGADIYADGGFAQV